MEKSETIGKLAEALSKAQGELKPAIFDATNPHFKSKYATLGAIMDACKEPLSKYGLAIVQGTMTTEGRVVVETMLVHASGEWLKSSLSMRAEKDTAQGYGSVITYGRRYSLAAMVGIVADEDTDAEDQKRGQDCVKNMKPMQRPPQENKTQPDPIKTQATPLADRTIGAAKPADEFTPEDAEIVTEPAPEVKAAARPKSAVQVGNELKQIRELAVKAGCKNATEIKELYEAIVGHELTAATSLNDDERQTVKERIEQMIAEKEAQNNG